MVCVIKLHPVYKRTILYGLAVLLAVGWALGTFYWSAGTWVHVVLLLAIIALLFGVIQKA
ncbi:lmo0937 family membrane protein [Paracnuella aquatica]|nr:lmo0937 family membrane protein [Paracnuella aquatica]